MSRVERWEQATEWPLAGIAVAFLVAYAWPILDPDISMAWKGTCRYIELSSWLIFAVDYAARLAIADDRRRYATRHILDLLIITLPVLRPLRLLRLLMLLRVLNRWATGSLRGRVLIYVVGAASLVVGCSGLAMLDAERGHPGASINSYSDALWWALSTITTVGYGDRVPVTDQGRLVAVALMLGGIALIAIITASMASWFVEKVREVDEDVQAVTRHDIERLHDEIRSLRDELQESRVFRDT